MARVRLQKPGFCKSGRHKIYDDAGSPIESAVRFKSDGFAQCLECVRSRDKARNAKLRAKTARRHEAERRKNDARLADADLPQGVTCGPEEQERLRQEILDRYHHPSAAVSGIIQGHLRQSKAFTAEDFARQRRADLERRRIEWEQFLDEKIDPGDAHSVTWRQLEAVEVVSGVYP